MAAGLAWRPQRARLMWRIRRPGSAAERRRGTPYAASRWPPWLRRNVRHNRRLAAVHQGSTAWSLQKNHKIQKLRNVSTLWASDVIGVRGLEDFGRPACSTVLTSPSLKERSMAFSGRTGQESPPRSVSCWGCCGRRLDALGCSTAIRGPTRPRSTAGSRTSPARSTCGLSSRVVR